jgi:hypothetical protein
MYFFRYEKTLSDCHECYTNQRRILLTSRLGRPTLVFLPVMFVFSVQSAIQDLAIKNERDMCTLVNKDIFFRNYLLNIVIKGS